MYAVPVTKVLLPRLKTLKKLSTTLKMNYKTHVQSQSLSDQAAAFRTAYGTTNSMANRTMQLDLIAEEYQEFRQSMREGFEQELKELSDLVYVCFQYAENMGWDLEEALDRVHKSNMSKLGVNGKPIRRRDGKIMKGPNYEPPNLTDLVT
jgi:predicted HAD superfamily Cof-like phosphohydrolase